MTKQHIKFRVACSDSINDGKQYKSWNIIDECGNVVGHMEAIINDLFGSVTTPGYSTTVLVSVCGKENRKQSFAFQNRCKKEALENRSVYVSDMKAWAKKIYASFCQEV